MSADPPDVPFREAIDAGLALWPYGVLAATGGFLRTVSRGGVLRSPKAALLYLLGWLLVTVAAGGAVHVVVAAVVTSPEGWE